MLSKKVVGTAQSYTTLKTHFTLTLAVYLLIPMKNLLLLLLVTAVFWAKGQDIVRAKVLDQETKEPLAFVNILFDDKNIGVSTDIDGKFEIPENASIQKLTFSYVGYKRKELSIDQLTSVEVVLLERGTYDLNEVVVLPGVNPAHRIIDLAISNRKINNPEKATEFFYESYNKLVITGELDTTDEQAAPMVLDSSDLKTKKHLEKHHIFLMESVTERSHIPPTNSKEVVTGSRVSGFKNPMFSLIGTQLQSFSLYQDYIELFGLSYLSPISKGSTSKYLFVLEDTLFSGADTIFRISFQPRKGKNFEGLKGILSINTNLYAVQNFIAEPYEPEDVGIKIQQKFQFVQNKQWFPVQLNTFLLFGELDIGNFNIVGIGKSYIQNIQLESPLSKSEIGNTVLKINQDAGKKDSTYWEKYRQDELTIQEENTYQFMDSVGDKVKLDEKVFIYRTLLLGRIPVGPIDFTLKHLFGYNGYEGFRLGLGVETNDRLISWLRIGGYGAYGFKDKRSKYGGHLRFTPKSNRMFESKLSYERDVIEVGGVNFINQRYNAFSSEQIRDLYISLMDEVERTQFEVSFRALRDFHFTVFGNQEQRTITSNYSFLQARGGELNTIDNRFNLSQAGISLRYKAKEKFVEMFGLKLPVPSKTPEIKMKYTRAFQDPIDGLNGDFQFNRLDLSIDQRIKFRNVGETKLRIMGGTVDEFLPISLFYRTRGTFNDNYRIASEYNFETIAPNEFFSDRYINVFWRHSFKNLLFSEGDFKPFITITSAFAIGDMLGVNQHQNLSFSTLEHGFFESGIQLDNLVDFISLGVGAFYRYGAYSNGSFEDNVAVKLSSSFTF